MLKYSKQPRSVAEFSLMKGVTDFSNLKQFDMFETGYSGLVVCGVPTFMDLLAKGNDTVRNLQKGFVSIVENEFKGLSGIPDVSADASTISNGVNELQMINNVTMDTSIQVSMTYNERSGALLTKYAHTYLTGIKDPYSKAKTYHGLIAGGQVRDPGPDYEVFTLLYYVTDNTMRKIEKAYLLANAQLINAQESNLYNAQRSDIGFPEVELTFNCYPIVGDKVNLYAAKMLEYQLSENAAPGKRLILDSNDFEYSAFANKVEGGDSIIQSYLSSVSDSTINDIYGKG